MNPTIQGLANLNQAAPKVQASGVTPNKRTRQGLHFVVTKETRRESGSFLTTHIWTVPASLMPTIRKFAKPFGLTPQDFLVEWGFGQVGDRRRSDAQEMSAASFENLAGMSAEDAQLLIDYAIAVDQTPAQYVASAVNSVIEGDTEEGVFHPVTGKPIGLCLEYLHCLERIHEEKPEWDTAKPVEEPRGVVEHSFGVETFTVSLPAALVEKLRAFAQTRPGLSMEAIIAGNVECWQAIDHEQREREFIDDETSRIVELEKIQPNHTEYRAA